MDNQNLSLTTSNCHTLFDNLVEAIIVFSDDGKVVFYNHAFNIMADQFKQQLITQVAHDKGPSTTVFWREDRLIKRTLLSEGFAYLIAPPRAEDSIAELTLKKLSNALEHSENMYVAAAEAIYQCLQWRWVAITRFRTPTRLEVLAFWDTNTKLDEYEFDLVGTPCEMVVDTKKFTFFSDVLSAFPNYQALHKMGAKTYAGLVYRGPDNQPLGHVMTMHDHRDVDFVLAEEVINIATLALSSHFQLHKATVQLKEVQQQVKIDTLTGVGNRHAYEDTLLSVNQQYSQNANNDWTIAIIDLDNLKPLNDNMGHNAGDSFIKLMATELGKIGRQTDMAFRIGGDEFAVIFNQSSSVFVSSLLDRFDKALHRVRLALQFPVGASVGLSFLSETQGDIDKWTSLADERMYENKRKKRDTLRTG